MDQSVTRTQYDPGTIRKFKRMSCVAALLMVLLLMRGERGGGVERSAAEASFSVFGRSDDDHRSLLSEPVEAPYITGKSPLIAVCVTGLYRSGTEVMPYIRNSYPKQAHVFVVTNANHSHLWDWVTKYVTEERTRHQEDGIRICMKLIEQYEQENHLRFDWIARQRIDTIGCFVNGIIWKSVPRSTHLILVPHGNCQCFKHGPCVADNWALMSRPILPIYAEEMHGHGTPENGLYRNLRRKNVSIWHTGICPAFQMVRTVQFMKTARRKVVVSNKTFQYPVSNLSSLKTRWVHYNVSVSFSKRLIC